MSGHQPVITGLEAGQPAEPARLRRRRRDAAGARAASGINILSTPAGILVDREARQAQCREASSCAPFGRLTDVAYRKAANSDSRRRQGPGRRAVASSVEGPKGKLDHELPPQRAASRWATARCEVKRAARRPGPRDARPDAQTRGQYGPRRQRTASPARSRSSASATAPRRAATPCTSPSATPIPSSISCLPVVTAKVDRQTVVTLES